MDHRWLSLDGYPRNMQFRQQAAVSASVLNDLLLLILATTFDFKKLSGCLVHFCPKTLISNFTLFFFPQNSKTSVQGFLPHESYWNLRFLEIVWTVNIDIVYCPERDSGVIRHHVRKEHKKHTRYSILSGSCVGFLINEKLKKKQKKFEKKRIMTILLKTI